MRELMFVKHKMVMTNIWTLLPCLTLCSYIPLWECVVNIIGWFYGIVDNVSKNVSRTFYNHKVLQRVLEVCAYCTHF